MCSGCDTLKRVKRQAAAVQVHHADRACQRVFADNALDRAEHPRQAQRAQPGGDMILLFRRRLQRQLRIADFNPVESQIPGPLQKIVEGQRVAAAGFDQASRQTQLHAVALHV